MNQAELTPSECRRSRDVERLALGPAGASLAYQWIASPDFRVGQIAFLIIKMTSRRGCAETESPIGGTFSDDKIVKLTLHLFFHKRNQITLKFLWRQRSGCRNQWI